MTLFQLKVVTHRQNEFKDTKHGNIYEYRSTDTSDRLEVIFPTFG